MEKVIQLTKEDIKGIVKNVINEDSINAKKRNIKNVVSAFEKGKPGYNAIKTFAVFTGENPDSRKDVSKRDNRNYNKSLLADLKKGGYIVMPAKGQFENTEHPFMVLNISLDTCKILSGKYQQTSFIYHILEGGKVVSQYWEKADTNMPFDPNSNNYVMKDQDEKWNNEADAEDYYTSIGEKFGKPFKYSIPFSIFNEMNERINENLDRIVENRAKNGIVESKEQLFEQAHRLNERSAGNGMYRTALRRAINKI